MKKTTLASALLAALSTTASAELAKLDPILVYSASATPMTQDQTASSVTVLTERDFAARNATYVSDILKTVPGSSVAALGGRGTATSLFLRGANSKHTTVIVDGIKINPVDTNVDFGGLSLSHVERIEILRGEQSALWGSDAMGGVVYITTKNGLNQEKPFNLDFHLGSGSHGSVDGSATISGQRNGFYYALQGDSHRTRGISAQSKSRFEYETLDGMSVNKGGAKENDPFHRDHAALRLGFDDSQKGMELLASHASQTVHFDNSVANETLFDDHTRTRESRVKLGGYLGNNESLLAHKINLNQVKTRSHTTQYSSWSLSPDQIDHSDYASRKQQAQYQLDLNIDRSGSVTQTISLLSDYQQQKYHASAYQHQQKKLTEKSAAAEYRLLTDHDHSLSLSTRYTDNSLFENAWTARAAAAYRLLPTMKVHSSIGKAIHNPTMSEYYGWSGTWLANPHLKAEKSLGGDIGVLLESADKRHSLDTTYFARQVDNYLDYETPDWVVYKAINRDGKTKIKGIEVAYQSNWTDALSSYANYTYTRIKADNDQYGVNSVRRPKHTANVGLHYQIDAKWASRINLAYVGNRLDSGSVKMPSYTLVNVGTDYQLTPNLNVYLNLNNLFDKRYEHVAGYGQDGRNIYVGLKGHF